MKKVYLFDQEQPPLRGTTPTHRKASAAAETCDGWMGAERKPRGETRVVVTSAAFALLEGLFFEHVELMRAKGWIVQFFRKEWGYTPTIQVSAQCGARLVVAG